MAAIRLDVRLLEPCEPLEQILTTLNTLSNGDYLHVLHRLEPFPLYKILQQHGFKWIVISISPDIPIELFIWRENDVVAYQAIQDL
jgi:uncharacterized protein (DUF2249 family)